MSVFRPNDHPLYFVYGSSMNPEQMAALRCKPEFVAVARLADHRLAFFGHSRIWDSGHETVMLNPGGEVWGVVFRLSLSDADLLDEWQGVRMDGSGSYFLCPAEVADAHGVRYRAVMYKRDACRDPSLPSKEYMAHIMTGALRHGLPVDYIEQLTRVETRKAGYRVPKNDLGDRPHRISCACSGCG